MRTAAGSTSTSAIDKLSKESFYSLLVKHQLNMIEAWNPSTNNPFSGINPLDMSKVLLQLKAIGNNSLADTTIIPKRALQSYQDVTISKPQASSPTDRDSLGELVNHIAKKNDVPQDLFQKLIQTESAFDPEAKSSRGAMGLGQLMPATAQELGLNLKEDGSAGSVWHPESNLDASARYLKKLFDKYIKEGIPQDEAWNFAAGAYNAGMGNIGKAMDKVGEGRVTEWDQVAAVLPQVTGKYSSETIRYVNRLRA